MPAIAAITLADGQATPVNHTFTIARPQNGDSKPSEWRDLTTTVRSQQVTLTGVLRKATGNQSRDKVSLAVLLPIVRNNTAGVAEAIDTASCRIEFTLPNSLNAQERKDLLAYAKGFVANAQIPSLVVDQLELF